MSYDFDNTVREWSYTMQKLNQQDLDRNFALATTHLVKWMQAVRAIIFFGSKRSQFPFLRARCSTICPHWQLMQRA